VSVIVDITPHIPLAALMGSLAGGVLYAVGKLAERLAERHWARVASKAAHAAPSDHPPAPAGPAASPAPRRDGVPTRALTDVPTTAYRPERP